MAGSVNKVILVGNLGRDPEVRHSQDGAKIVQLSVATGESWRDKATGERRDRTEWHRVVIFNDKLGEVAERFLKKGSKVYVEGQLQTRKWTDNNTHTDRYTTEVVLSRFRGELTLLDARGEGGSGPSLEEFDVADVGPSGGNGNSLKEHSSKALSDFDDEIPF